MEWASDARGSQATERVWLESRHFVTSFRRLWVGRWFGGDVVTDNNLEITVGSELVDLDQLIVALAEFAVAALVAEEA